MKHLIRIAALLMVIAGAACIQAAKQDVDKAFRDLQYGYFDEVLKSNLGQQEILRARKDGNSLIAEAILSYKIAWFLLGKDSRKAVAKLKQVIAHLTKGMAPQDRKKLLDAQNAQGQTALMFAAQHPELRDVARELHTLGADMLLKDKDGRLASDYVYRKHTAYHKDFKDWEELQEEGFTLIGDNDNWG